MSGQPSMVSPPQPGADARERRTSRAAIASLVLGVLSCGFSFLTGIPAIICGAIGLSRIGRSESSSVGPRLTGQGLAIAGIILGGLSLLMAPILVGLLLPAVQAAREAARRANWALHVREVGHGMLIAESALGALPAAIIDEDGKPLLSWRVAILPYLEQRELYERFHLDEPWDSPHNRALIPLMPACYGCPGALRDAAAGRTTYLAAAGPGMALGKPLPVAAPEGAGRLAGVKAGSITDGMSKTILLLEVAPADAVAWSKPEDFVASPEDAAARLFAGSSHAGGIHMVLFGDTHVEPLAGEISPAVLAALLTRSGGEVWDASGDDGSAAGENLRERGLKDGGTPLEAL